MKLKLMMKFLPVLPLVGVLSLLPLNSLSAAQTEEIKKGDASSSVIQETVLGMNVSGNKELPNVLYIIPWKGSEANMQPPEIFRLVDEIYAPVDPEVFSRQVNFYYQLTEKNAAKRLNKATIKK